MPKENPPVGGIRERYSEIHTLDEYTRYLQGQVNAAVQSGQISGDPIRRDVTFISMMGNAKLARYLNQLDYPDKIKLIHALIINDMDTFTEMIVPPLQSDVVAGNITIDATKAINALAPDHLGVIGKQWLTPLTRWIIKNTLKDDSGDVLDDNESSFIVGAALSQIPDTTLSVHAKRQISLTIGHFYSMPRVQYVESVPPMTAARDTGEISAKEFRKIVQNKMIDKGEYILICLGLLQSFAGTSPYVQSLVDDIRYSYLYAEYDDAISLLKEIARTKYLKNNQRAKLILQASTSLVPADKGRQFSRRFFENRLAALSQGQLFDTKAVMRVAADYIPGAFTMRDDPADIIRLIAVLGEVDHPDLIDRSWELKDVSVYWAERGRSDKEGVLSRHAELDGFVGQSIFTQNTGIMRSIQPNYRDELALRKIRNSSADTSSFNREKSYIKNTPDTVYVTGYSGHAFFFVAILEDYMAKHQHSPTLEHDVNEFIKALAIANVGYGFHSIMEILEVFDEPEISKIFSKYRVDIQLDWSDELLDATFADAQSYAKTQLLQQAVARDVERYHSLYDAIKKNDFKRVAAQLEKQKQRGEKVKRIIDDFGVSVRIIIVAIDFKASEQIFREILKYHSSFDRYALAVVCIESDYMDGVKALAGMGYEFGVDELKYAIKHDNLEIVQYLVDELHVPVANLDGRIKRELFKMHRSQAMYEFLIAKGEVYEGGNHLHRVIASRRSRENKCHAIVEFLNTFPEKQIEVNEAGETPLQLELSKLSPDPAIVLTIVKHANFTPDVLNVVDGYGYTPLMRAVKNYCPIEVVHALIAAGADLKVKNSENQTIIDMLEKLYISKKMLPAARLIISEVAKANPKLLEKYAGTRADAEFNQAELDNKRFYVLVNEALNERKTKSKHHKKTAQGVSDHPSMLFSGHQSKLTPRELFAAAMWQVKVSFVNMNKSEGKGSPDFQSDMMSFFELIDSLGRGKLPNAWQENIEKLLTNIENYIKSHPGEERNQLRLIVEQSRKNIAEYSAADNKRLGMK